MGGLPYARRVTSPATSDPRQQRRGVFLALEGVDGAGKSTQAAMLGDWLRHQGYAVTLTREPGGTELGRSIREVLLGGETVSARAEALLFAADRAHHVETLVRPALARDEVVVSDRFADSSVAYQSAGRDLDADEVARLSGWATDGLVPDLTVVLDVSPELGRSRLARRRAVPDRMETEPDDFHLRVRRRFLALAAGDPSRYLVVDAGLDPSVVHERVRERVAPLLSRLPTGREART